MKKIQFTLFVLLLSVSTGFAGKKAQLKLPKIFGDNMVLQQNFQAPVWGWAEPGKKITTKASWLKKKVVTRAAEDGSWNMKLQTPKAGGPYSVKIKSDTTYNFKNVLIGEVWLCSGQSNMEMPVDSVRPGFGGVPNFKLEIATANFPEIRLFTFPKTAATEPQIEVIGSWNVCCPATVPEFSAVAYFFGKELYQRLNVPIGLMNVSWGGSAAEAWTNAENLLQFPEFKTKMEQLDSLMGNTKKNQKKYENAKAEWNQLLHSKKADDFSKLDQWMDVGFNDTSWNIIKVPHLWSHTELAGLTGSVWFRTIVNIPEKWQGKNLKLHLGPIDEMDITWFNSNRIGEHKNSSDWTKKRSYTIPAENVLPGKNTILLHVTNDFGEGGIYGDKKNIKICAEDTSLKQEINLSGEWRYKICLDYKTLPPMPQEIFRWPNQTPTLLYNGMLHPLIPFAIKGVTWYQGESNAANADLYSRLFPVMIKNWRQDWNQGDFPFYFVQIAPYNYKRNYPSGAELRESQLKSLSVLNTGMAVTMVLGHKNDIHPRRNVEVGKRLALWALARDYGFGDIVYSGPFY
ncbi:hypothetical protein H8E88_29365, partial [candidate division KSB1 bacterium]|nr:hypothetical protein [candidate division KSB1 bacterium]